MAKDVITRFKLETTGFDSKIKEAAKELSAYSKTATQAKEGFNQFTKANVDAARALGTMATSTTNVKDKVKELVGAYNNAAKAYEALTKEQQQSDWAKALAGSLTQLQQRIKETKAEMQGLGDSMKGANDGGLLSKLGGKMDGALAVFGGNLMTKAASMGVGLVTEMTDAVKQGIELAKAGEGVRIAFERLGRGDILQGLREATHGTVTDLELMKAAVKFNDFKLPVEELGTMLAFAQQKAKDTGQSVDYMVDSIVTGLGRKSLMILDNLGLSATEIRERMKETGDMTKAVGAIIRDQMAAAGDYVETAADRAAQANVSLQNKMEELGRKFAPVEEASNHLWTSMKIGILDIIGGPLATLLNQLTEAGRLKNALNDINGDGSSGNTVVGGKLKQLQAAKNSGASQYMLNAMQSSTIEGYNRQIMKADELLKQFEKNHSSVNVVLQNATKQFGQKFSSISELEAWRDAYKVMVSDYRKGASEIMQPVKPAIETQQAETNVKKLRQQLKELEEQRKKAVTAGDQEQVENLTKQIGQVKTNIGYLDPKANKSGSSSKTVQTELQQNQAKITELKQQFIDIYSTAAAAGKPLTKEQEKQTEEIQKQIELLKGRNELIGMWGELAEGKLTKNNVLSKTPVSLINPKEASEKTTDIAIPRGGLQLDDKAMRAVTRDIYKNSQKEQNKNLTKEQAIEGMGDLIGGVNNVFGGLQQMGIEIPQEISSVMGVLNGILTIVMGIESIITVGQFLGIFHNGGIVPGFANGGVIDSGHSPSFLSFSKAAPAFATGGIIQKFNDGGTVEAGHAPDFLSFSKAMQKRFATGGVIPHANGGYFVGGTHYSSDVTPIMANAGELILNKVQQNTLAGMLTTNEGMGNLNLTATIKGEQIRLALNNNGRRTGRGEYVQSRNVR